MSGVKRGTNISFKRKTASCHLFRTPESTAQKIKDRIRDELGGTVKSVFRTSRCLQRWLQISGNRIWYTPFTRRKSAENVVSPRIGNVLSGTCHDQETLLHGNQDHQRTCTIRPCIAESSPAKARRDNLGICQQHRPFPSIGTACTEQRVWQQHHNALLKKQLHWHNTV